MNESENETQVTDITGVTGLKMLQPKVDVVFKLLFGDKRNTGILIEFLKSVLSLSENEYEKITLEDTHLKRETIDDKLGIVDVRLTTKSGKIIHIEMQVLEQEDMPERVTYYNAKMLVTQLGSGGDYDTLKKTVSIVVADFEIVADSPKYHHRFQLNDEENGVRFTDIVEINTLELQKIPDKSDNTEIYDWLQFLSAEREEEFDMIANRNPAVRKAVVELKRLSQDEEAMLLYETRVKAMRDENARTRLAMNRGRDEGRLEGRLEGAAARNIDIAKKLLKRGIPISHISEDTGLSTSEIEELKS